MLCWFLLQNSRNSWFFHLIALTRFPSYAHSKFSCQIIRLTADRRATNAHNTPVSSCPVVQTVSNRSHPNSSMFKVQALSIAECEETGRTLRICWRAHRQIYKTSEILAGDGITFGTGSTSHAGSPLNKRYLSSVCWVLERGFVKQKQSSKVLKSTFIKKGDKTRTIKTTSATFWD